MFSVFEVLVRVDRGCETSDLCDGKTAVMSLSLKLPENRATPYIETALEKDEFTYPVSCPCTGNHSHSCSSCLQRPSCCCSGDFAYLVGVVM